MYALIAIVTLSSLTVWIAYIVSRHRRENVILMLSAPFACLVWYGLVALGFGPQSLSNVVEIFIVLAASILFSVAKIWLYDRITPRSKTGIIAVFAILLISVVFLRLTMPVLPE